MSVIEGKEDHVWEKKYIHEIRRCSDMENKIEYFEKLLAEFQNKEGFEFDIVLEKDLHLQHYTMDELESTFEKKHNELKLLKSSLEKLYTEKAKSQEQLLVIKHASEFITQETVEITENTKKEDLIQDQGVRYIAGIIPQSDVNAFYMVLFRQTSGNVIFRQIPIEEKIFDGLDKEGNFTFVQKTVYIAMFSAGRAKERAYKHCSIASHIYNIPAWGERENATEVEKQKIQQLGETIVSTNDRLKNLLSETSIKLDSWKKYITLEKTVYDTMNKFDYNVPNSTVAEAWIPKKQLKLVQDNISLAAQAAHAQVDSHVEEVLTHEKRPTYFELNKVTQVFQDMTDAYSVPAYKEVNPAPITMITFPFLFAVMFGDLGHATILFLASLSLVLFENQIKDTMEASEILIMLYQGRYLLLLMSIFALYTGLLYNDIFGLSLNLWGSRYKFDGHGIGTFSVGNTYEFGVDPAWYETTNKLMYYNSLKMKMAIIFGVTHMLTGTVLKFFNFLHFKQYAFIFMEAIPEFLILSCSFGYLCFMIIYKWCINWQAANAVAPDLLKTMSDFFLHFADPITDKLYAGQQYVQITLLVICAISVPLLLIPTPVYHIVSHYVFKKSTGHHGEEFSMQEILIHQLIHTIEYVLGAVSNTASYLRLWALSLAHAQLSEVFFSLTIKLVLTLEGLIPSFTGRDALLMAIDYSALPLVVAYTVWIGLTVGVLLGMETLSAFLHTLRLHWVEFNSKYYKGEGIAFEPLSYVQIMKKTVAKIPEK